MNFSILLTESAVKHLTKVMKEGDALHLGLKTHGCNGYGYTMDIKPTDKDNEITVKGIKVVVLKENREKLDFCTIDYKKDGLNSKLAVENPHVKYQCGCGESVSF